MLKSQFAGGAFPRIADLAVRKLVQQKLAIVAGRMGSDHLAAKLAQVAQPRA